LENNKNGEKSLTKNEKWCFIFLFLDIGFCVFFGVYVNVNVCSVFLFESLFTMLCLIVVFESIKFISKSITRSIVLVILILFPAVMFFVPVKASNVIVKRSNNKVMGIIPSNEIKEKVSENIILDKKFISWYKYKIIEEGIPYYTEINKDYYLEDGSKKIILTCPIIMNITSLEKYNHLYKTSKGNDDWIAGIILILHQIEPQLNNFFCKLMDEENKEKEFIYETLFNKELREKRENKIINNLYFYFKKELSKIRIEGVELIFLEESAHKSALFL